MTDKPFIHENFLLQSKTAEHLFHDHAKKLPIIDYHCHLNPQEVAQDHKFRSITELWLGGDHYKWRALRTNGTPSSVLHRLYRIHLLVSLSVLSMMRINVTISLA